MPRHNEDAIWAATFTGEWFDDGDGHLEPVFDYELAGSEPLSPFEAMAFAACGVETQPYFEPFLNF